MNTWKESTEETVLSLWLNVVRASILADDRRGEFGIRIFDLDRIL